MCICELSNVGEKKLKEDKVEMHRKVCAWLSSIITHPLILA